MPHHEFRPCPPYLTASQLHAGHTLVYARAVENLETTLTPPPKYRPRRNGLTPDTPRTDRWTPRKRRFAMEYLIDFNGTQAAIRAGFSKRTAGRQSVDLLKDPTIAH